VAAAGVVWKEGRVSGPAQLTERHRLRWWEALPWLAGIAVYFAFPNYLAFATQVLITILFALSLDLVLGYAGIVTLGHAAFFGAGAYTVGMLAQHLGWNEPLSGLVAGAAVAGAIGLASGFVLLRTHGLTLLMLTLCTMTLLEQAANMGAAWTGGFDGMPGLSFQKILGLFAFDTLYFRTQYLYSLAALLAGFVLVRTLVYSSFGQSLTGMRENLLRMHAVGAPVRSRLILAYTLSAALAGVAGALFAQTTGYVNLAVLGLERAAGVLIVLILGGHGRLYGAFVGAIAYMVLEHVLAKAYPTAWQLGLGVTLIAVSLFARNGVIGLLDVVRRRTTAGPGR
jgi:branched-chain amino acid transport system permease protein